MTAFAGVTPGSSSQASRPTPIPIPAEVRTAMADTSVMSASPPMEAEHNATDAFLRTLVIGLTAFLTVVDLFATQAILPSLTRAYDVTPAAMGFAVNASTMGMAVAGLAVAYFS